MSKVLCNLKNIVDELDTTYHYVSKLSGIRPNTIYTYRDNTYKSLSADNLGPLLDAINIIAQEKGFNKKYDMSDLFLYKFNPQRIN